MQPDAAHKRGDWDSTKAFLEKGQDCHHRGGEGIRSARARRRRLPDRPEVELHAEGRTRGRAILVINADESEPGSCKDREIIRHDPHKLIEGALIAGFAMRRTLAYIYIRGEYIREASACSGGRRGL